MRTPHGLHKLTTKQTIEMNPEIPNTTLIGGSLSYTSAIIHAVGFIVFIWTEAVTWSSLRDGWSSSVGVAWVAFWGFHAALARWILLGMEISGRECAVGLGNQADWRLVGAFVRMRRDESVPHGDAAMAPDALSPTRLRESGKLRLEAATTIRDPRSAILRDPRSWAMHEKTRSHERAYGRGGELRLEAATTIPDPRSPILFILRNGVAILRRDEIAAGAEA